MVTVISRGPHPSVVKEVVCNKCGSLLQYTPVDVQKKMDYDYVGPCGMIKYIACPPCGNHISVK